MDHDKSAPPLFQAAQYLRMSMENQCYGCVVAIELGAKTKGLMERTATPRRDREVLAAWRPRLELAQSRPGESGQ
jgi:hypothetical protein